MKEILPDQQLIRILVTIIIVLALAVSYYEVKYRGENLKYLRLEDKFVRVRTQLGRDETQRLIDESY